MLLRPGGRHDIYLNPATGKKQPVPRHTEVDEHLARHIRRVLGVPE
jgi:mRNA interferase HicA